MISACSAYSAVRRTGFSAERVEQNGQQLVHAAKCRTRGSQSSVKTTRRQRIEDLRPARDDVHRHAPRCAFAGYRGGRLMIAEQDEDAIAIRLLAQIARERRVGIRDGIDVAGPEMRP